MDGGPGCLLGDGVCSCRDDAVLHCYVPRRVPRGICDGLVGPCCNVLVIEVPLLLCCQVHPAVHGQQRKGGEHVSHIAANMPAHRNARLGEVPFTL